MKSVYAVFVAVLAVAGMMSAALATPINFTVNFDLVNVTGTQAANGSTIYTATARGPGPFETANGPGPVVVPVEDFGEIVANYLSPRYFGSDAAQIGSLILNFTNFKFVAGNFQQVPGVAIGGFRVLVAQPTTDNIISADGGSAFSHVAIAADGKSVVFSGGDILNEAPPAAGETEVLLWSGITPGAPQPQSSDVYTTTPTIPPDPNGEFADLRLVGQAVPVSEPSTILMFTLSISALGFVLYRQRHS